MEQEKILAWHFVWADYRTEHGNILMEAGKTYSTDKTPVLCRTGFHASERLLDALIYAPSGIVCRVEVWGSIRRGNDKLAAQNRRVLWMLDIDRLLHEFACDVAEETLLRNSNTSIQSWNAIRVKRAWLAGKATDAELAAAGAAAWDAAWAAAWAGDAAGPAAWSAAWAAAGTAAGARARAVAWAAAWAAAWATDAARAEDAASSASWNAAWSASAVGARAAAHAAAKIAAGAAAWADLNTRLEARVLELADLF